MPKHALKTLTIAATLALAASASWAQTSSTVNPPETKVGVTPEDAKEATQKAVPRSDTGTVVRTGPSAAERAGDMTEDAKNAANRGNTAPAAASGNAPMNATPATPGVAGDANARSSDRAAAAARDGQRQRPARADRN
ncbi:hypothetical protein [Pulveribacter suum]|uniref:Cell envelope biogenesis protein TolA n=1 Tax=Pulveribacter suum TaxID=2116657 RepID=A0A2P1NHI7_9BURK|nr:hypothetical protein [Pulveribacter suum]AVP56511.1 hypothetical protein C7H73_01685 [Pulveribacter suum]